MTGVFEDHLSLDAVVAYVDGELSLTAFQRVAHHLHECADCAREVAEQAAAARTLRTAGGPRLPADLLNALRAIPSGPGTGEITAFSRTLPLALPFHRPDPLHGSGLSGSPAGRTRRNRLGAGALVAGLAVGALATGGFGERPITPRTPPPVSSSVDSQLRLPAGPAGQVRNVNLSHRR